jgi:hypothetical protein
MTTEIVPAPVDELVPWPDEEVASTKILPKTAGPQKAFFPDHLPGRATATGDSGARGPGILIPLFEVEEVSTLSGADQQEGNLIRKALDEKRAQARALQLQASALEKQWRSLLSSAGGQEGL